MTSPRNPCKAPAQARSRDEDGRVIQTWAGILMLITTTVLGDLSQAMAAFRA